MLIQNYIMYVYAYIYKYVCNNLQQSPEFLRHLIWPWKQRFVGRRRSLRDCLGSPPSVDSCKRRCAFCPRFPNLLTFLTIQWWIWMDFGEFLIFSAHLVASADQSPGVGCFGTNHGWWFLFIARCRQLWWRSWASGDGRPEIFEWIHL